MGISVGFRLGPVRVSKRLGGRRRSRRRSRTVPTSARRRATTSARQVQDERIRARVERIANGLDRFNARMEERNDGPRQNVVELSSTSRNARINLWLLWGIVTLGLLFVSPWTLIVTGAWAVYLLSVRQRGKRLAAQREHDAVIARLNADMAEPITDVIPAGRLGKHARRTGD